MVVGIGWDINAFDTGGDFDLDAAAFCLTDSGKVSDQKDFVFYGNLTHPSGAIQHMGDNLTGAGDGDDEQIKIDLSKIPANINKRLHLPLRFMKRRRDAELWTGFQCFCKNC